MYRRTFLGAALAGLYAAHSRAWAQAGMDMHHGHGMPHGAAMGHGMAMDHGAMGQGAMDAAAQAAPRRVVPLPQGQPLRELPRLANASAEPGVFEATLTAAPAVVHYAPGLSTPVLAYNGASPGPLIEAYEGDRVAITFANRIPGQDSTVHWHGMPVPADQDGNPMDAVASGADRPYRFTLPAGSAATYWYHPHPHGRTAEQVYRGLAGVFIVRSRHDPIPAEYGDTVLMFTDLRLAEDGTHAPPTEADAMNGRIGDHVLVNGQKQPVMDAVAGARRRLRLINATNARYLRLAFEGATMTLVGSDGGLLEKPVDAAELLLAPAERAEVVVTFPVAGPAALRTLDYDSGWMGPGRPRSAGLTLLDVQVAAAFVAPKMSPVPATLRAIAPLSKPVRQRRFVFTETMSHGPHGMAMQFLINGAAFDMKRIDVTMQAGQVEQWEIENQADMDHPFHVHGVQFQVTARRRGGGAFQPEPWRTWKDTVNVPHGEAVRISLRQDTPGLRMYHCHILEHEDQGMMGMVKVEG
ncbi:multicopper oxidase family protein [Bordetella genomosp. 13]|uniref:multicopper oxidase family protein n=1 Tax=Bordetella genomosp. 13 TaxID=463040 RepID=UPI00119FDE6B|nr:multicopper oxidase family protein [Bordetella genomosp. 13]